MTYNWNDDKNEELKQKRKISFEEIVICLKEKRYKLYWSIQIRENIQISIYILLNIINIFMLCHLSKTKMKMRYS